MWVRCFVQPIVMTCVILLTTGSQCLAGDVAVYFWPNFVVPVGDADDSFLEVELNQEGIVFYVDGGHTVSFPQLGISAGAFNELATRELPGILDLLTGGDPNAIAAGQAIADMAQSGQFNFYWIDDPAFGGGGNDEIEVTWSEAGQVLDGDVLILDRAGSNLVWMGSYQEGLSITGDLAIMTGNDPDMILITDDTIINGSLSVDSGGSPDLFFLEDGYVGGSTQVSLGGGHDFAFSMDTDFQGNVAVDLGSGDDTFMQTGNTFNGSTLSINGGSGTDAFLSLAFPIGYPGPGQPTLVSIEITN